jgi:hypothetical protein
MLRFHKMIFSCSVHGIRWNRFHSVFRLSGLHGFKRNARMVLAKFLAATPADDVCFVVQALAGDAKLRAQELLNPLMGRKLGQGEPASVRPTTPVFCLSLW